MIVYIHHLYVLYWSDIKYTYVIYKAYTCYIKYFNVTFVIVSERLLLVSVCHLYDKYLLVYTQYNVLVK